MVQRLRVQLLDRGKWCNSLVPSVFVFVVLQVHHGGRYPVLSAGWLSAECPSMRMSRRARASLYVVEVFCIGVVRMGVRFDE